MGECIVFDLDEIVDGDNKCSWSVVAKSENCTQSWLKFPIQISGNSI